MNAVRRLRPICRPLHTGIFQSPEYRCLPDDGTARLLFFCLLVHPHGGTFHLPGLYNVGHEALREVVGLPKKVFQKALSELMDSKLILEDEANRLIWVSSALRLIGPPQNPNVVKGYVRSLAQLNHSSLIDLAVKSYIIFLEPFGLQFVEPFLNGFETISESLGLMKENPLQKVNERQLHINRNKDLDINSHHNANPADRISSDLVHKYAAESGWPSVPQARLEAWLSAMPGLTWEEFVTGAREVQSRQDVREPLPYLFALLGKQREACSLSGSISEMLSDVPDGTEITFRD